MRGSEKRVIFVRDTGSRFFEEAYFIVRRGVPGGDAHEADMVQEAQRIVSECGAYPSARRYAGGRTLSFLAGAASAGALIGGAAALMTVL